MMTQFQIWSHSRTATDIAETLINSLWQAAIVAAILAALLTLVRSSRLRYGAACGALLVIAALPFATFAWLHSTAAISTTRLTVVSPFAALPPENAADANSAGSVIDRLRNVLPWVTPVWLAGVILLTLRNLANWFGSYRLRHKGSCAAPDAWQKRLDRLRQHAGISKPVELLESCVAQIPVVIGHMRPVILIPIGFVAGLPVEQAEMILMHELAHVRRWDYAVNLLQSIVEGLMFFNPFVLWISRLIRTEREHCCDDYIVALTNDPHGYAAALTALEEGRTAGEHAVAATGGILVKRIRRLLYPRETANTVSLTILIAGILIVAASIALTARPVPAGPAPRGELHTAAPTVIVTPPSAPPAPEPAPPIRSAVPRRAAATQEIPATLKKWLDEDVSYIITTQERAAFLSLGSDKEREGFIYQFWLRRDPTPGTSQNEFRDEIYRRIGYSNQKFAPSTGTLGWKTDRGRFYITAGPPDELESHPAGSTYADPNFDSHGLPLEIWLYRHLEGVGNNLLLYFVDANGSGEFPLANPMSGELLPIKIMGAVHAAGVYNAQGQKYLLDVLEAAQGLNAGATVIEILRHQNGEIRTITIRVSELFDNSRPDLNIPILPGDVINVF